MHFLINLLITSFAVWLGAAILPGVSIKSFKTAIWVAFLLAIVNVTIGWILRLITTPFNWLTLGLVHFVISVLMVMLADKLVANFIIKNFWWATALAIIISITSTVVGWILHV